MGNARVRGSYETRKAQAIAAGRERPTVVTAVDPSMPAEDLFAVLLRVLDRARPTPTARQRRRTASRTRVLVRRQLRRRALGRLA